MTKAKTAKAMIATERVSRGADACECPKCGGLLREVYVERSGKDSYLSDFERLAWICEACGEEAEAE